jgi:hypothetical protein
MSDRLKRITLLLSAIPFGIALFFTFVNFSFPIIHTSAYVILVPYVSIFTGLFIYFALTKSDLSYRMLLVWSMIFWGYIIYGFKWVWENL